MSCYKLHSLAELDPGEVVRCILHHAGQEFEDVRVGKVEWPKLRGDSPVLETPDGKKLGGTIPIAGFLGQKVGMAGNDEWDRAQIDSICDIVHDTVAILSRYWSESDPSLRERKKAEILKNDVPQRLAMINKLIVDNGHPDGFVYGKGLSYADFFIHFLFCDVLTRVYPEKVQRTEADKYPGVSKQCKTVHNLPNVKKYLDKRSVATAAWNL